MNFSDIIALAWRNLRQAKLRTALTVIGVIVGVAAVVTMVSFGLGLQNNLLKEAFARIDFFTSITVFGPSADALLAMQSGGRSGGEGREPQEREAPTSPPADPAASPSPASKRVLDDAALDELRHLEGVRYVVPLFTTSSYVEFNGRTRRISVGGAPLNVEYNPRFKDFLAGHHFSSEAAREAVVTERFLRRINSATAPRVGRDGRERPEPGPGGGPVRPLATKSDAERQRDALAVVGQSLNVLSLPGQAGANSTEAASVFGIPLLGAGGMNDNLSQFEKQAYTIVGVLKTEDGVDLSLGGGGDVYLPLAQAQALRATNSNPMERMGELLVGDTGYPSAEVRVADISKLEMVKTAIKTRGFNFWNIGNQIDEIKRVFLIVNASLALIGGLALLVASFGISNTMIMSIRERTREIGIMKAIGGSDGEVTRIFFVEASLIGLCGGVIGVACGWGIDRAANVLANRWVTRQVGQAIRQIEFFSIPWYLSGGAILFAVLISLIAAVYPATRAAKVDPIKALRYE